DPSQIELVILNLAINARDAMVDGGTITIKTSIVKLGAPARPEEPTPGDYVMCSVADTGTGIPDDILDQVFEPFFTTKEVGKGSGLGLPQVLGVAKQLGGGVRIQTRPGAGTTVNVYLPRAREDLRAPRLSSPGLPPLFVTRFANTAALAAQTNSDLILSKTFRTTELVAKIEEALLAAYLPALVRRP